MHIFVETGMNETEICDMRNYSTENLPVMALAKYYQLQSFPCESWETIVAVSQPQNVLQMDIYFIARRRPGSENNNRFTLSLANKF